MDVKDTVSTYRLRPEDLGAYLKILFRKDIPVHFEESKNRASEYPTNLVRTEAYRHTLESYRRKLNAGGLFHPDYRGLGFIELYEGDNAFRKSNPLNTVDQLGRQIDEEDVAPFWRMIFLRSKSNREALGCSKDQLTLLLTYHQVMPSFLDFVLTFCTRERPVTHAIFRHEDYLEENSKMFLVPPLKRSGVQIQHAFNILSVERADERMEKNQWPLRQVAAYYSFDVINGRSLWIVIKGNPLIARRIVSAMEHQRRLRATAITDAETSFIAALEVHMIMIDWCSENWAEYIEYVEELVNIISIGGKTTPVDEVTAATEIETAHSPRATNTFGLQSQSASIFSSPRRWKIRESSSNLFKTIRRVSGLESRTPPNDEENTEVEKGVEDAAELQDERDKLSDLEKEFSFRKYQSMSQLSVELERALVVIEQNKGVLEAIEEHYHSIVKSYGFTTYMKKGLCDDDLAAFFTKIRSTKRELETHHRRLQTVSQALDNDKAMFSTLLQYKSEKVSEYFASSAKVSSDRMEDIAVRTEQETLSMHVITIFTLIFLPGTFIATLFSSGVFRWDDDGSLGSDWVIRQNALKLFFSVCVPMMVVILVSWSVLFIYMRRKRQQGKRKAKKGRDARRNLTRGVTTTNPNQDPRPFTDFSRYIDKKQKRFIGLDASDNDTSFIPFYVLRDYWTKNRISSVLKASSGTRLTPNIDNIHNHYIRIFSILVYDLNDAKLPLKQHPAEWSQSPIHKSLFDLVFKHQWIFFPLIFNDDHLDDHCLDDNVVLPIEKLTQISQGDAAIVQMIKIDDSCNSLTPKNLRGRPDQDIFVLKTYHSPKFERLYVNEIKALRLLKSSPSPNIVTYYGSFQQNGTYNIILEHADKGDLADLFKERRRPEGADIEQFWKSLVPQCLDGLGRIHHLMMNVDEDDVNGIHEDIKPANILLFKGRSGSRYDFVPKIADFGLFTHVRKSKANSSEAMGLDNLGNQLYSSPECSHTSSYRENAPNMISTKADIFSFGAVLSDACAWVKGGPDEKARYYEQRRQYHQSIKAFRGSDYEGCFHDGVDRLPVVDQMHNSIRDHCRSVGDSITPRVIDMIEQHMLLPNANSRYNAKQLRHKFNEIFDIPVDGNQRPPIDTLASDLAPNGHERGLCLTALGENIDRLEAISHLSARKPRDSIDLEIQELVDDLSFNVSDRHHIFFFDDSTTMERYAQSVEKTSLALIQLARLLEGNNVELSFASNPKRLHRRHRMKKLAEIVAHHGYRREPGLMELGFGRLVDDVIIPHLPIRKFGLNINPRARKPTSIYVFTDGDWGNEREVAYRIERPIQRLNKLLQNRKLDKNHISFHFVRLGDSENGREYLDYLDSFGRDDNWDNVDVKNVLSPVKDIVIGPLVQ
ncbi:uncharacterized protein F4812DRAFT_449905 [Daldinia caldariorum]|uniref:uncharacterized protein n=1 Tax=Daldinia caldariorum TaxID=326644 RepID=UPI002007BF8A|nr:uncharacterized protein F4812DRAFT_449905 [Daldinia caldariorum]KAI1470360.1 hypothetical protein F4812DRAFT_449905 [Daldinia caldariorum]